MQDALHLVRVIVHVGLGENPSVTWPREYGHFTRRQVLLNLVNLLGLSIRVGALVPKPERSERNLFRVRVRDDDICKHHLHLLPVLIQARIPRNVKNLYRQNMMGGQAKFL